MELTDRRARGDLKKYFVKNAIPTESNFAELIEGMLNQRDDGLVKEAGDPLSIEASGNATSQRKALNLYADFEDEQAAWVVSLRPREDPSKPETAKPGFSVGGPDGKSRFFIDKATGKVGIGTLDTQYSLNVSGDVQMGGTTNPLNFTARWTGTPDRGATNVAEIANDIGTYKTLMLVGNRSGGSVRRVGVWDRLEVNGTLHVTQGTSFPNRHGQQIDLYGQGSLHAIGTQHYTTYFRTANNFAWYKGGTFNGGELNAGGGTAQMVIKNGKVGIGTETTPYRLNVGGYVQFCGTSNPLNFTSRWTGTPNGVTNVAEISNDTASYKTLMIVGNKSAGVGRRVSVWDRLEVNGTLAVTVGATIAQERWKPASLTRGSGWIAYSTGYNAPGYFKDSKRHRSPPRIGAEWDHRASHLYPSGRVSAPEPRAAVCPDKSECGRSV